MSQFHYGSIKTQTGEKLSDEQISLNSTMVRLKLELQEFLNSIKDSLNSTMVRLKHYGAGVGET